MGGHKGKIRTKLSAVQVQKLLRAIQKRISEDQSLTATEFTSLTASAAELAGTLHKLDVAHIARRNREKKDDLFAKRGNAG
jgi:hypothetical protein